MCMRCWCEGVVHDIKLPNLSLSSLPLFQSFSSINTLRLPYFVILEEAHFLRPHLDFVQLSKILGPITAYVFVSKYQKRRNKTNRLYKQILLVLPHFCYQHFRRAESWKKTNTQYRPIIRRYPASNPNMSTTHLTIHDLLRITYTYEMRALEAQARMQPRPRSDSACSVRFSQLVEDDEE